MQQLKHQPETEAHQPEAHKAEAPVVAKDTVKVEPVVATT